MDKKLIKKCLFCNKNFAAKRRNHLFCSNLCSKGHWRKNNPEKIKKYLKKSNKKWRNKNRDKIQKRNKEFVQKHLENRRKIIQNLGGKCSCCDYSCISK